MVESRSIVSSAFFLVFLFLLLLEPTFEQQQQSSPAERAALLELRSSLGLRSKEWPRKADPCFFWNGVQCENGRVVGLNISGFRRTRLGSQNPQFAVDALVNLTLLTSFNASKFLLPGSIPDWFGQRLSSLRMLDLRSCSVFGSIPMSLGNLTNLTSLYLSNNNLSGTIPASLGQLSRLSVLDLSQNLFAGSIPRSFSNLQNLSLLDISDNSLSGSIPPGIGTLLKLQYLNVSRNNLSSFIPAQLGDLDSLVDFDLSFNSLSGSVPSDLRGLRNLQRMELGNNFLVGTLPDNLFSPQTQLQFIVLSRNNFTGGLPTVLWSIPRLRFLDVSGNNFTGELKISGSNANATAAVLNISQNLFYGNLTPLLGRFSDVDLSSNYFEGRVPDFANTNASLDRNCLQNLQNQRSLAECTSFYAERGLTFDNFGHPNSTLPPPAEKGGKSNRNLVIILATVLGGIVVILLLLLLLLRLCARRRGSANQRGIGVGAVPASSSPPAPGVPINFSSVGDAFTYQQLLQATGNFSDANLIKHGHSGDLFRGELENGMPVVIKRIDLRSIKKESYLIEFDFFSKVSHTRFVPFVGHCLENENEKFLVYKHMPNGDLSTSLYKKANTDDNGLQSLDWITRLKIALGAAEGLSYLHNECNPPLVHRDVQASSILLDDKFEVRLGSLSEVCGQEGDTHQSRITRLLRLPQSSEQGSSGSQTAVCAYDVYCFGKVLLELVTGKLGISASSDAQMKEWLEQTLPYISIYDKELVTKILDPSLLIDEDLLEEVWAMAIVARSCLNPKPSRRPLMRYILKALENPLKVVREESSSSARLRTTSSRGSWNAALFGSWRSSSDVTVIPASTATRTEGGSGLKRSGTTGSQGSGNGGGDHSSSHRRHSREIFPEPSSVQDVERADQD
ncbi:probable LRR receptor-like serine/threonine-protein kinase At2g16250 [Ziziphus jujuba]|uniref:Probable LRR receptor-like serine/threonine-protein kinase At2g16250 n=1 Tax=Ziziphus jujuba TaxID=326968 RepID=A0A6P4AE62_ZIZJJ|nr:probable LRR receptor-like serine/threonine-protein kinase At2g16250 [Ziziphus jujuba]